MPGVDFKEEYIVENLEKKVFLKRKKERYSRGKRGEPFYTKRITVFFKE